MTRRRIGVDGYDVRTALDAQWVASDANDFEVEHQNYRKGAVLDYPQSGERIGGWREIRGHRVAQTSAKRFAARRIVGAGALWITELALAYSVGILEFRD